MGEARRRGSYEERKLQGEQKAAIEKALHDARNKEIEEQNAIIRRDHAIRMAELQESKIKEPGSQRLSRSAMLASVLMGIGHIPNGE